MPAKTQTTIDNSNINNMLKKRTGVLPKQCRMKRRTESKKSSQELCNHHSSIKIASKKRKMFMSNGISAELLKKDDLVKIRIADSFMIENTAPAELNKKVGTVVSISNGDVAQIMIRDTNEIVSVPKFFCCLKTSVYQERIKEILKQ